MEPFMEGIMALLAVIYLCCLFFVWKSIVISSTLSDILFVLEQIRDGGAGHARDQE